MGIETDLARLADAAEIIAAHLTGQDKPRTPATTTKDTSADDAKAAAADKAAKDKAAKDAKAAKEAAAKAAKDAKKGKAEDLDPMGGDEPKPIGKITQDDVRDKLTALIEKEGKAAALKLLHDHGAENFTKLPPEKYEDVYVAVQEQLAD